MNFPCPMGINSNFTDKNHKIAENKQWRRVQIDGNTMNNKHYYVLFYSMSNGSKPKEDFYPTSPIEPWRQQTNLC